ncbi:MAG: Gfo/Idh/MocA family oxidoreductase [Gallionella sp.]
MYKAAIIGCGMIAGRFEDFSAPKTYSHAKAYRRNSTIGELAFFDLDGNRAKELAAKAGGKAFATISEIMVDFRPDIASVCTPDNFHYSTTVSLLQGASPPKIIFVEKPVCNDRQELGRLIELERASDTRIIVNHSRRFDAAHQRLKVLLNSGDLGPLVKIHVDYYGGWRHLGVHIIDILQYMLDALVEIDRVEYHCESKYADDPTLDVTGRIGNARLSLAGFLEDYYQILDMNIMCQRGQIKVTDFGNSIDVFRKAVNSERENVLVRDPAICEVGMRDCISNAIRLICNYLDSGDRSVIEPYGLSEAQNTMNTIWKGTEKYATQS